MSPLEMLREEPQVMNPALLCAWAMQHRQVALASRLPMAYLIEMAPRIEEARSRGETMLNESRAITARLRGAATVAADVVLMGF